MRPIAIPVMGLCLLAASTPLAADACQLNLILHGTFHVAQDAPGRCLQFLGEDGVAYDVTNPHGSWKEGMSGTIYAETEVAGACAGGSPVQICNFDADFSRNVVGELIILNFIECPGYMIRTSQQDYRIDNCEDFGDQLCNTANLGRKLKAEVVGESRVSICISVAPSTVVDYEFLGN